NAAMGQPDTKLLELGAFLAAGWLVLQPGDDADRAREAIPHHGVELMLLRAGDSQVSRPEQGERSLARSWVVEQLGGQRLAEGAAGGLSQPKVAAEPRVEGQQRRVSGGRGRREEQRVGPQQLADRAPLCSVH